MIENKKYNIKKDREERTLEALESIATSLRHLTKYIISDPGDEVEPIVNGEKSVYDLTDMD